MRLGTKKCCTLHIGKQYDNYKHVPLFVDGWKVQTVESYDYNKSKWEDILEKDIKDISNLDSEKYLGQILSRDSRNIKNITKLRNKGIGIKNKVIQMLTDMPGGPYHFKIGMVFTSSYPLFSIL